MNFKYNKIKIKKKLFDRLFLLVFGAPLFSKRTDKSRTFFTGK